MANYQASYDSPGLVQGPQPQADTAGFQGMVQFGSAGDNLAYRLQRAQDMTTVMDAKTALLQQQQTLTDKYKNDTDFNNFRTAPDAFQADWQKAVGDITGKASPQLSGYGQAELTHFSTVLGISAQNDVQTAAHAKELQNNVANWGAQSTMLGNAYANAKTDTQRAAIEQQGVTSIAGLADAGWINADVAQRETTAFRKGLAENRVATLMQSDPATAKTMLADPQQLPALDAADRIRLQNSAAEAVDQRGSLNLSLLAKQDPASAAAAVGRATDPLTADAIYHRGVAPAEVSGDATAAKQFLASISNHPERPGDTSAMHPDFAQRLAAAAQEARAAGLPVTITSGVRDNNVTGSAYDAAGLSLHGYGAAADVGGIGSAGSPQALQWAAIAQKHGLVNPYGVNDPAEFNHWQLVPWKLENRPDVQAGIAGAKGDMSAIWNAVSPITPQGQSRSGEFRSLVANLDGSVPAAIAGLSAGQDRAKTWVDQATARYGANFTPDQYLSVVDDKKASSAISEAYARLRAPTDQFGMSVNAALRGQSLVADLGRQEQSQANRTLTDAASLQRATDPVAQLLQEGYAQDPGRIMAYRQTQMAAAAGGDAGAAAEVRRLDMAERQGPVMKAAYQMAPSQLAATVASESQRLAQSPDVSPWDVETLKTLKTVQAAVDAGKASNPVGLAERQGMFRSTPVDPQTIGTAAFADALSARSGQALQAASAYDGNLIPFKPDEASALKNNWEAMGPAQKAGLAATMATHMDPKVYDAAMGQVAGGNRLDLTAGMLGAKDPALAEKILTGGEMMKDKGVETKIKGVRDAITQAIPVGLYPTPQANSDVAEATAAVYAANKGATHALIDPNDSSGIKAALEEVTGPLTTINGRATPIPKDFAPGAVRHALDSLTADDVKPLGGLQPGVDAGWLGAHAQLMPLGLGRSDYQVLVNGQRVLTADGRNLQVDLRQLAGVQKARQDAAGLVSGRALIDQRAADPTSSIYTGGL